MPTTHETPALKVGARVKITRNWRMGSNTFEDIVGGEGTVTEIHDGDGDGWVRIRVGSSEGSIPAACLTALKPGPI